MTDSDIKTLTRIASEMVRSKNMPSPYRDDWDLPDATPGKVRIEIEEKAKAARAQCREWSLKIMNLVKQEREGDL